ncbi:MAG: GPR endopeptidase [Clostridia bacterium]|nr:GPR endopeptidase [Clostridia bacterium]
MNNYTVRSDLAAECVEGGAQGEGILFNERSRADVGISEMRITSESASEKIGKPIGKYITLDIGRSWIEDDKRIMEIIDALHGELSEFIDECGISLDNTLVAGLGNRSITSDALGPLAVDGLTVTRHIKILDPALFERLGTECVSAISPGVAGQTGFETFDLIAAAAAEISPSLIIIIDALAARSTKRLATTVQLTDTGISPGSGIGNNRKRMTREDLGAPVIVIGVPTIVDSGTLVRDALTEAGIEEIPESLSEVLDNGQNFFVTLKESDVAIESLSRIISSSLNKLFQTA